MVNYPPRILLALSALILLTGGLMHAMAFRKMVSAVGASNLPAFYANSLKGLWLIDAATLMILSVTFALIAARPSFAGKWVIILMAVIPAATAYFLYRFIGNFLPAHMLAAAAGAAIVGALLT